AYVHGGRIGGDWPGLAPAQLNEGRDVRATSDLRGLFKRVLVEHVGLADSAIESKVFPGSRAVAAMQGVSLA
ncbi:hypothetical protein ACFQ4Q_17675, partial [Lysobacter gummosus]